MRKVYHKIIQIAGNVITVEADNVVILEKEKVLAEAARRGITLIGWR